MLYKALFLPVDKPLEDGCDCVNSSGEHLIFEEHRYTQQGLKLVKRAEMFLVSYEFNQLVVIGKPSPEATWLKNGMDVKACDCELWLWDKRRKIWCGAYRPDDALFSDKINFADYWRIKCPTCQVLH